MQSERQGRCVVITGGGRGVGAACARLLAQQGERVVLAARSEAELRSVAAEISAQGGQARWLPCDIGRPEEVERLFAFCEEVFGPASDRDTVPAQSVESAGEGRGAQVGAIPGEEFQGALHLGLQGLARPVRAHLHLAPYLHGTEVA